MWNYRCSSFSSCRWWTESVNHRDDQDEPNNGAELPHEPWVLSFSVDASLTNTTHLNTIADQFHPLMATALLDSGGLSAEDSAPVALQTLPRNGLRNLMKNSRCQTGLLIPRILIQSNSRQCWGPCGSFLAQTCYGASSGCSIPKLVELDNGS